MKLSKKIVKKLVVITIFFTLVGCSNNIDLDKIIEQVIKDTYSEEISTTNNLNKSFYSLYYGREVGRVDSNLISNVFSYNSRNFILVVNVNNIIKDRYYPDSLSNVLEADNATAYNEISTYSGQYVDCGNEIVDYLVEVAKLGTNEYYLKVSTSYLTLASILNVNEIEVVLKKMLNIARTTEIYYDEVVNYFANVEAIADQNAYTEEIFEEYFPTEGYLGDLIKKDDETFEFGDSSDDTTEEVVGNE
ncbi:MAG: hypothetical protein ACK5G7_06830 [Erysipelotrichaceae bacterium]